MVLFVTFYNKYLPAGNSMHITLSQAVLEVLLVFTALYLSSTTAAATKCSVLDEVEIYQPNVFVNGTEKYQCVPCPKCPFGQGGSIECGTRVPRGTPVECRECVEGKNYSDVHDRGMCKPCPDCGNKRVLQECSLREKTVCSNDCKLGFHYKSVTRTCEKCSPCCMGKKYAKYNIYPRECRDMPLNKKCERTHFTDICPHMRVSSTASYPTATLISSKTKTTLKTTPSPRTTTPSLSNDADQEHKSNKTRVNTDTIPAKEESSAKSLWAIVLYVVAGILLTIAIMVYINKKKWNGISSNNSSTTTIPDEIDESQDKNKKNVKIEMELPNFPVKIESRLANQSDKEQPVVVLQSEELSSMISRIPNGHLLSDLPGDLVDHVSLKLDSRSTLSGWRKVGLRLGVDKDRLDALEIEYMGVYGSPTAELLKGLNAQFPDALTKTFVETLHREKRDDIAKSICNWKW